MPYRAKSLLLCLFIFLALLTSASLAFSLGLFYALTLGNPYQAITTKISKWLLQVCVVGLGFGIQAEAAFEIGLKSFTLTLTTVALTLGIGIWLGKKLTVSGHTTLLISAGTAICGGSAIAAVASTIRAKPEDTSLALAIVFGLNAVGLFIFPILGDWLGMSGQQFALWAAIAIHDTSSVVGAAQHFGDEALILATTVKLQRTLWIIPLVILLALIQKQKANAKIPWFIGFFVLAVCFNSLLPDTKPLTEWVVWLAKKGLIITLFFIGASVEWTKLKNFGGKPLRLGLILWCMISLLSLAVIIN